MAISTYRPPLHPQRGATLLIALIMLVIMTLLAVSSFNMGDTNLKIVANAQEQQRVRDISELLLNERLHNISSGLSSDPCDIATLAAADGSLAETRDGVTVTLSRTLTRAQCIKNGDIKDPWLKAVDDALKAIQDHKDACDADETSDACKVLEAALAERDQKKTRLDECLSKPQVTTSLNIQDPTIEGAVESDAHENSYCVDVVMEIRADAVDTVSNARASIVRGIALLCSNHDIPEC